MISSGPHSARATASAFPAPVASTINGTPTEDFVLGPTGVVTFIDPPASDAVLGWSGNFLYRCRFVDDELSTLNMWLPEIWELKGLKFVSVII